MSRIVMLGRRIELVSMDKLFHEISIGLYEDADATGGAVFAVHSYSGHAGTAGRLAFIAEAMRVLGGMEPAAGGEGRLRFACGASHRRAVQRLFIEVAKLETGSPLAARPMATVDKKSGLAISVVSEGAGCYRVAAEGEAEGAERRIVAVSKGLARLAELEPLETDDRVRFPCGHAHDPLIGLLLVRALNVRAAMREAEAAAARGILMAPSAQQQP